MATNPAEKKSIEIFLKSWRVYQDIIEHNYMFHREITQAVADKLLQFKPCKTLQILDLGCGDASMALPLLSPEHIAFYLGCDLSQPALDIAHQKLSASHIPHKLICDDMLQVAAEQRNDSIDLVISSYAIHHLNASQKQQMIQDISRIMSPGGCLILIDIFREPAEDRAAYMRHYMGALRENWTRLSTEGQDLVVDHATNYDFPEQSAFYETLCQKQGIGAGKRLAKHTWHEAWCYTKT